MPELPEVETTRRGIAPHVLHKRVVAVEVREPRLRWPVPETLQRELPGRRFDQVLRRGKYLLLTAGDGTLLLHLGMSGNLRILPRSTPAGKHDHLDIVMQGGTCLRLQDPRRFGAALWFHGAAEEHPLLARLGPEPLTDALSGGYLYQRSRGKTATVKTFVMDSKVVVGVGNIYANEALFLAGIHPRRAAGRIGRQRYGRLADCIKDVLADAIAQGGTTLRDFRQSDGRPGYFQQTLAIYGREGRACPSCTTAIRHIRLGQRSTFYCPRCQR